MNIHFKKLILLFILMSNFLRLDAINPRNLATIFCQVHEFCFNYGQRPSRDLPSAKSFVESVIYVTDSELFYKAFGFWNDIEGCRILENAFELFKNIQIIQDRNPPKDALFKSPIVCPSTFSLGIATRLLIDKAYSKHKSSCVWPNIEEHPFNLSKISIEQLLEEYAKRLTSHVTEINRGKRRLTIEEKKAEEKKGEILKPLPKRIGRTIKHDDIASLLDD